MSEIRTQKEVNFYGRQELADKLGLKYAGAEMKGLFNQIESGFTRAQTREKVRLQEKAAHNDSDRKNFDLSKEQTIKLGGEDIRIREINYPQGRSYLGVHADDVNKVAAYMGVEPVELDGKAKSVGIQEEKVAWSKKQAAMLKKFPFQHRDNEIPYGKDGEYKRWVRDNMNELGLNDASDLAKHLGVRAGDAQAILSGNLIKGVEDTKLYHAFTPELNKNSTPADIIRHYRNGCKGTEESRCSNVTLSVKTGISGDRLKAIVNGDTLPRDGDLHKLIEKLGIEGKHADILNANTLEKADGIERNKHATALDALLAKYDKGDKGGHGRN